MSASIPTPCSTPTTSSQTTGTCPYEDDASRCVINKATPGYVIEQAKQDMESQGPYCGSQFYATESEKKASLCPYSKDTWRI